jgi:penicillin-binding protein-related factor A (putative recombinase)
VTKPDAACESVIKRQIVTYLQLNRVFCWVQHNVAVWDAKSNAFRRPGFGQRRGVSDILGIFNGRLLAIEVKTRTGRPSTHQISFIDDVKRHGGIAFIARSVDDVILHLAQYS